MDSKFTGIASCSEVAHRPTSAAPQRKHSKERSPSIRTDQQHSDLTHLGKVFQKEKNKQTPAQGSEWQREEGVALMLPECEGNGGGLVGRTLHV